LLDYHYDGPTEKGGREIDGPSWPSKKLTGVKLENKKCIVWKLMALQCSVQFFFGRLKSTHLHRPTLSAFFFWLGQRRKTQRSSQCSRIVGATGYIGAIQKLSRVYSSGLITSTEFGR